MRKCNGEFKKIDERKIYKQGQVGQKVRRVDRRTNALQTNQQTDQPTDTASYRGALSHLKMRPEQQHRNCLMAFARQPYNITKIVPGLRETLILSDNSY